MRSRWWRRWRKRRMREGGKGERRNRSSLTVGWVGSGNGERNKKELAGTKRKPRLWGVVVVNPHPRVRSATTLPPALSLSLSLFLPLLSSELSRVLFPSSSGSRLLRRLPSSSVYISSFLKFLNIRSIGSRSLGKNRVGRHEMSTVGTAVSLPAPRALSARKTHRRCFRQDLSVFHREQARPMPPRVFELIIRYPFVALRSFLHPRNARPEARHRQRE